MAMGDLSATGSPSIYRPKHGGNLAWAAQLAHCSPSAILDFSASINPLGPPASAIAAIQTHLRHLKAYPDPSYTALREAIAAFHHLSPDWVLPGNGSAELLTWAGREFAGLQQTYLITPAFSDYRRALQAFGATIVECPLHDWGVWVLDLPTPQVPATGLLLNNPHNPTGMMVRQDTIAGCLDQFELVVVDEAFMDFLPPGWDESVIDWVEQHPNLVVLRSLTKFYSLPGLRLGYAIGHPDRLRCWQQWRDPWAVNSLAEAVGVAVLADQDFQHQSWAWIDLVRPQLLCRLEAIEGLSPSPCAANFILVRVEQSVTDLQLRLLHHDRLLIRDCLSFPELGDRFFRVAVRTEMENQRLLDGLAHVLPTRVALP